VQRTPGEQGPGIQGKSKARCALRGSRGPTGRAQDAAPVERGTDAQGLCARRLQAAW